MRQITSLVACRSGIPAGSIAVTHYITGTGTSVCLAFRL
jgi:hypothetical protein